MALGTPTNKLQVYDNVDRNAYTTASVTLTAGRGYILSVNTPNISTTTPTKPTVSGAGIGSWGAEFSDFLFDDVGANRGRITVWVISSAAGSSGTIVIDYGGVTQSGCEWILDEFTGHDTSALVRAANVVQVGNDTAVTSRTGTLAALQSANNACYGVFNHEGNEAPLTIGAGFTQIGEAHGNNPNNGGHTQFKLNETVCNATWTGSQRTGVIAMEIQAAATGVPTNSAAPAITGNKWQGQTLTEDDGSWSGSPSSFTRRWQRDTAGNGTFVDIGGATATTYVTTGSDLGNRVRVGVIATNGSGDSTESFATPVWVGPLFTEPTPGNAALEICANAIIELFTPGINPGVPTVVTNLLQAYRRLKRQVRL